MLDMKVLTAVFASLVAVATGMNGGNLDAATSEAPDSLGLEDISSLGSNPLQNLRSMFVESPEPENEMRAELKVGSLRNERIRTEGATLRIDDLKSFEMATNKVSSDEEIVLQGFSGSLKPGNNTLVKGSANGFTSSGVNVSGVLNVDEKIGTERVEIAGIEKLSLSFSEVEGEISSESASTTFRNGTRALNINSFSGTVTVFPRNNTVILDGKVDRFEAGEFSFGG